MRKVNVKYIIICISIYLSLLSPSYAATINASSNSQVDVQTAINSASNGDTVHVPAGNGSVTWSSGVTINNKSIKLIGPGKGNLTINSSGSSAVTLWASAGGSNSSRVSGFSFNLSGTYAVLINPDGGGVPQGWRVDNCSISRSLPSSDGIFAYGDHARHPDGLIDSCTFTNARVLAWGDSTANGGRARWSEALNMGSVNAVYVENCTFTFNDASPWFDAIDSMMGGRYVFRFNTIYNGFIEAHSLQGDNQRAGRLWEVYNNSFNETIDGMWIAMRFRGGTGVVFNNVVNDGFTQYSIPLDNVRSCENRGAWGFCDGNSWVDGNTAGQNGWPCRDQIGRSTDASLWSYSNPAPSQASAPAYAWKNKRTDGLTEIPFSQFYCAASIAHIQPNRDYYNYTASFNGTSGVGNGTLASRPATCTTGVAYWATDQGSWNQSGSGGQGVLYKCTATNTWTLHYTPYTYPHPLTQGTILAPQRFRIQ